LARKFDSAGFWARFGSVWRIGVDFQIIAKLFGPESPANLGYRADEGLKAGCSDVQ
jgi:hypothetical protein